MFDCLNTISKERRKKVNNVHDFLGSGHPREVTTTSATMKGIVHFLNFSMGETTMKDNVNTTMIKIIIIEEVVVEA